MSSFELGQFQAMGTEIEVLAAPQLANDTIERVARFFESVEARLSRFRKESELSRLNDSCGRPFRASPLLREVLEEALEAARGSDSYFDPTVLDAVEASGYRSSFDQIGDGIMARRAGSAPDYNRVEITADGRIILRDGVRVDLGGFAKGWTVDRSAGLMAGFDSWLINAGGDLLARGPGPNGEGWVVGVEDPFRQGTDIGVMFVRDTALATSTTMRRRWRTHEGSAHHIIDPRTGEPAETDLASVTVEAPAVAEAEVLAKTVLLMGRARGLAHLERTSRRGLLVTNDGYLCRAGETEELHVA